MESDLDCHIKVSIYSEEEVGMNLGFHSTSSIRPFSIQGTDEKTHQDFKVVLRLRENPS